MVFKPVRTPCIGVCSTGIGDSVCRGCKRFAHEIISWNGYSNDQRLSISLRLDALLSQVVQAKIEVVDVQRLRLHMEHQQIRFNPDSSPYCWVFDLLKAGASQIQDVAIYGLALQPGWRDVSMAELKGAIDRDFFTLSCAHYERYIAPGLPQ